MQLIKGIFPKSQNEDLARKEFILNVLLLPVILMLGVASINNTIRFFGSVFIYQNNTLSIWIVYLLLLFFVFLYFLSRKGFLRLASYMFSAPLFLLAAYMGYIWGVELTSEILALQKIKQENEELRAILKFGTETRFTILPSRIIHITNKDGEQAILLDNGAKDGIVKGNAVVVLNGTIIGKVIEVSDEVARVRLTTDNKSAILATVGDGANFVAGVASGSQNTAIKLDLIPKNIPLSEGMRVYTNGLEEGIPSSLYIGSISALEESDNEIFNAAAIVPPYSIENFITASVITHS